MPGRVPREDCQRPTLLTAQAAGTLVKPGDLVSHKQPSPRLAVGTNKAQAPERLT
jgi:hypothetical protein